MYAIAAKRSLDKDGTRKAKEPWGGNSKSIVKQQSNRSIHKYNLCQKEKIQNGKIKKPLSSKKYE